ncbi:MAG: hypothetical protein CL515_03065 [Actinobacteria bacterium]|nr:hypothetical protein [Actinomycetota bacterium]|tara:strand:+ start:126 stop:1007 length:882 start_codon:yes stop_codon:yes gene_type:complete
MAKHLLDFKDLSKKEIEKLIESTQKIDINSMQQTNSLSLLKFDEPSTRTRLAFSVAAHKLGIKTFESNDAISSKIKGEELEHEIETYKSMGISTLVIRTEDENIDDYKECKNISIISAGFGTLSHPTQAILDAATLNKFNKLDSKIPITYIGDVRRSRVFESGRELLSKLGYKVGVFTHKDFLPDDVSNVEIFNSWDEVFDACSAVELLRVQKERIDNIDDLEIDNYIENFQVNESILDKSRKEFIVMHPMTINVGIEISEEAAKNEKFKYRDQLAYGISSRITSYMYSMEQI